MAAALSAARLLCPCGGPADDGKEEVPASSLLEATGPPPPRPASPSAIAGVGAKEVDEEEEEEEEEEDDDEHEEEEEFDDDDDFDESELERAQLLELHSIRDRRYKMPHQCAACGGPPSEWGITFVVSCSTDLRQSYDLGLTNGTHTPGNSFRACDSCHYWRDQRLWWVELDGEVEKVVVADWLLADEASSLPEDKRRFTRLHGRVFGLPPHATRGNGFPFPALWEVQKRLCKERKATYEAAGAMACAWCDTPYTSIATIRKHEGFCKASLAAAFKPATEQVKKNKETTMTTVEGSYDEAGATTMLERR